MYEHMKCAQKERQIMDRMRALLFSAQNPVKYIEYIYIYYIYIYIYLAHVEAN